MHQPDRRIWQHWLVTDELALMRQLAIMIKETRANTMPPAIKSIPRISHI